MRQVIGDYYTWSLHSQNVFLIWLSICPWDITWANQINRQYTQDFSAVAHPPCVGRSQGTKWTAIKEDEWGIWISHPGSPHYMSYSFFKPSSAYQGFPVRLYHSSGKTTVSQENKTYMYDAAVISSWKIKGLFLLIDLTNFWCNNEH